MLIRVGYRAAPGLYIARSVMATADIIGPVLAGFALRALIDGVTSHDQGEALTGALLGGLALAGTLIAHLGASLVVFPQRERLLAYTDRRLMELTAAIPGLDPVERPVYRDRLQQLRDNQWRLHPALPQVWEGTMIAAQFLVSLAVIVRLQPWLLTLPLLGLPAGYLTQRGSRHVRRAWDQISEPDRRARHLLDLATTASPARELRVFGSARLVLNLHRQTTEEQDRVMAAAGARQSLLSLAGYGLVGTGYVAALLLSVQAAAQGRLSAGDVALVMSLAGSAIGGLSTLAGQLAQLQQGLYVSGLLVWITDQSRAASSPRPEPGAEQAGVPERLTTGIEVDHVSFRYPDAESDTLRDISLRLAPGTVVALVGENGAGKTSLIKLLTRMYRPTRGRILLDGHDIQCLDINEYRARLTAGFQDFARLELLARETVTVGDLPRLGDPQAAAAAVGRADATDVARSLPRGLETQLGGTWPGGAELSGGQWQKLAVARTLMRTEPLLAIFDEPTANIDAQTEHALFERLAATARGHGARGGITILVSHRFSTVRAADHIIVLRGGQITEQGTHADLMSHDGLYAELFRLQARAYQ
jgi:ATP-binding cassette, subfamily B, bacterial